MRAIFLLVEADFKNRPRSKTAHVLSNERNDWLNSFRGHMLNICLIWMDRNELLNDLVVQVTEPVEYRRQA